MSSLQQRGSPEDYFPHYVNENEVEFDYAYAKCRCGWESRPLAHPASTTYHIENHHEYGHTVDCSVGKSVLVFEDGSVAET